MDGHDAKGAKKRIRRNDEQLIADLEAKISAMKARAARKKAKASPDTRYTLGAVRNIDKAMSGTQDATLRKALEEARGILAAWLALEGIAIPMAQRPRPHGEEPEASDEGAAKRRRRSGAPAS